MTSQILFDIKTRDQVSGPLDCDWCHALGPGLQWRGEYGLLCLECRQELEDSIHGARSRREAVGDDRRAAAEQKAGRFGR